MASTSRQQQKRKHDGSGEISLDCVKKTLTDSTLFLCRNLEPDDLLLVLKAKGALTQDQVTKITKLDTATEKVDKLIQILTRSSVSSYEAFMDVLKDQRNDLYVEVKAIEDKHSGASCKKSCTSTTHASASPGNTEDADHGDVPTSKDNGGSALTATVTGDNNVVNLFRDGRSSHVNTQSSLTTPPLSAPAQPAPAPPTATLSGNASEKISNRDIRLITNKAGLEKEHLDSLFEVLEISRADIGNGRRTADTNDFKLQSSSILSAWLQKKGHAATRNVIIDALLECELTGAVDILKKVWGITTQ